MNNLAIVEIDKNLLKALVGLPPDADIVGCRDGFRGNTVQFKVTHKDLPEVAEGDVINNINFIVEQKDGKPVFKDWGNLYHHHG